MWILLACIALGTVGLPSGEDDGSRSRGLLGRPEYVLWEVNPCVASWGATTKQTRFDGSDLMSPALWEPWTFRAIRSLRRISERARYLQVKMPCAVSYYQSVDFEGGGQVSPYRRRRRAANFIVWAFRA